MEITEVRIKLVDGDPDEERLQAFVSITFDNAFVVRDLKLIEGTKGLFVAMPSRKLTDRCPKCGCKNHLRARFCNQCGYKLDEERATREVGGRAKLHADVAHPIHSGARESVQKAIIDAYLEERRLAQLPGYVCRYDDPDHTEGGTGAANRRHDVTVQVSAQLRVSTEPTVRGPMPQSPSEGETPTTKSTRVWSGNSPAGSPLVRRSRRHSNRL